MAEGVCSYGFFVCFLSRRVGKSEVKQTICLVGLGCFRTSMVEAFLSCSNAWSVETYDCSNLAPFFSKAVKGDPIHG